MAIGRTNSSGVANENNVINELVEQFQVASGCDISAGKFVKFANEKVINTQLSSNSYSGLVVEAILLSENKVFFAHSSASTSSTTNYLYGIVVDINGTTITAGKAAQISTIGYSGCKFELLLLSENKLFITHGSNTDSNSSNYLYGIVIDINGTTISKGADTQLSTLTYSCGYCKSILLSENKALIIHSAGSSSSSIMYGIVIDINNRAITKGTDTQLGTLYADFSEMNKIRKSVFLLSENKVLLFSINTNVYCCILTISGKVITVNANEIITTYGTGYTMMNLEICQMSPNSFVIAYDSRYNKESYEPNNPYEVHMRVRKININNNTITYLSESHVYSANYYFLYKSIIKLSENEFFFVFRVQHMHYSSLNLCDINVICRTCTISDTSILQKENLILFRAWDITTNNKKVSGATKLINGDIFLDVRLGKGVFFSRYVLSIIQSKIAVKSTFYGRPYQINSILIGDKVVDIENSSTLSVSITNLYNLVEPYSFASEHGFANFCGIAKTSGSSGNTIDVYVPI